MTEVCVCARAPVCVCVWICVCAARGRSSRHLFATRFLFLEGGVGYACLTGGKIGLNLPDEIQSRLRQNPFACFSCKPRENINYGTLCCFLHSEKSRHFYSRHRNKKIFYRGMQMAFELHLPPSLCVGFKKGQRISLYTPLNISMIPEYINVSIWPYTACECFALLLQHTKPSSNVYYLPFIWVIINKGTAYFSFLLNDCNDDCFSYLYG